MRGGRKLTRNLQRIYVVFGRQPERRADAAFGEKVAETGVQYYVIDCGWHNEEPGDKIYPYVGQWRESHARFPTA